MAGNKGKGRAPNQTVPTIRRNIIDLTNSNNDDVSFRDVVARLTPAPTGGAGPSKPRSESSNSDPDNFLAPLKHNKLFENMLAPQNENISNRENRFWNRDAVSGNESETNVIDGGTVDMTQDEWNLLRHGQKKGKKIIDERARNANNERRDSEYQRKALVSRLQRVQRDAADVAEIVGITDADFTRMDISALQQAMARLDDWVNSKNMTVDEMIAVMKGRRSRKTDREKLGAKYNKSQVVSVRGARNQPVYRLESPLDVARQMRTFEFIRQAGVFWRSLDAWHVVRNVFFQSQQVISSERAAQLMSSEWFRRVGPRSSIYWYALHTDPLRDHSPHQLRVLQYDSNSGGHVLFTFTVRGAEASRQEILQTSRGNYLRTTGSQFTRKQPKTSTGETKPTLKLRNKLPSKRKRKPSQNKKNQSNNKKKKNK